MHLILCGHKAVGKTTLAQAFSEKYAVEFLDTDQLLVEYFQGKTCAQIYDQIGSLAFRELEAKLIKAKQLYKPTIIATGGGAVTYQQSLYALRNLGKIVYLALDESILKARIENLSQYPSCIKNLDQYILVRSKCYNNVADYKIDISNRDASQILGLIYKYWSKNGF